MNAWLYALLATGRRTREAFSDPIRRLHLLVKVARLSLDVAAAVAVLPYQSWFATPAAIAADFVVFEYILEPWSKGRVKQGKPSLCGPYWESGPRTDEGERFSHE